MVRLISLEHGNGPGHEKTVSMVEEICHPTLASSVVSSLESRETRDMSMSSRDRKVGERLSMLRIDVVGNLKGVRLSVGQVFCMH